MLYSRPTFEVDWSNINPIEMLHRIERAGRTCYKSEDKITQDSARVFVRVLLRRGHESVIEHETVTARVWCNRGLSHEIVRHRLGSYSQESTRYCCYSGGLEFMPLNDGLTQAQLARRDVLHREIQRVYLAEISEGVPPEQARDNLPICLKTELVMTYNLRQWRHFFRLRASKAAHPQMRRLARSMLAEFKDNLPGLFDDLFWNFPQFT